MSPRLVAPYICSRCLRAARRNAYSNSAAPPSNRPPPPPASGATNLKGSRRLIALHGRDTVEFLHGITTANVRSGQTSGFYSAFLNAQGRLLNDVFMYPVGHSKEYLSRLSAKLSSDDPAFLIEVDASQVDLLVKHLKRYKLRAKADVRAMDEEEWQVWSVWDGDSPWTAHSSATVDDGTIGCVDARATGMGQRVILYGSGKGKGNAILLDKSQTTLEAYTIRRMLKGVPEGQDEMPREASLPHECNIDFMGGIDFKKGCYVGQELTIRTQHTGVVRKRILPISLYNQRDGQPEKLEYDPAADVQLPEERGNILAASKTGRPVGKFLTGIGNVGLGLCRLEKMTDLVLTAEGSGWSPGDEFQVKPESEGEAIETRIKAFVPDWMRNKIKIRDPQQRIG